LLPAPLFAAGVWDGGGADNNWSTNLNWDNDLAPANNGTAALTFGGSTRLAPNLAVNWDILGLTFNNTAGAFTIGGNQLTIRGSGVTNSDADTQTINNNLVLGAAQSWNATSGGLVFGGTVANGGFLLTVGGAANTSISGIISGTGGLTKSGAGTLLLTGANSFSGTTTVSVGALEVQNATGLGTTAAGTVVSSGATLQLQGGIVIGAEALSLSGNGVANAGALRNVSGDNTFGGAITIVSASYIGSDAGTLTLSNLITDTSAFGYTKVGAGTVLLSGASANTANGLTLVNEGTLILAKTAGVNAIAGALTIGDGVGTDIVQLNASNQIVNAGVLTVNSSGQFNLNGFSETVGATSIVGGSISTANGSITLSTLAMTGGSISTGSGTLTLGGTVTGNASASSATISGNLALGGARVFAIADGAATADLSISAVMSGAATISKTGAGSLVLSGANTNTGAITISGGTLSVSSDANLGNSANTMTINGGTLEATSTFTTVRTITLGSSDGTINVVGAGTTLTMNADFGSNSNWLYKTGAGTLELIGTSTDFAQRHIEGGTLKVSTDLSWGTSTSTKIFVNAGTLEIAGTTTSARQLSLDNAASTIQVDPTFTYTHTDIILGTGMLNKTGTGTMVLSGANTFSGGTNVAAGTLRISAADRLLNTGALTVSGGTFDLQTFSETVAGVTLSSGSITGTGAGTLVASSYALQSGTVTGILGGTAAVAKTTAGTVTLSGTNTYTGTNTISGGTLSISTNANLGNVANTVTLDAGTLQATAGFTSARTFTMGAGGGTFEVVGPATTLTLSTGLAANANTLTKTGTGTLALTAASTRTGITVINNGTLSANVDNALGSTTKVTVNTGGTLLLSGAGTSKIGNATEVELAGGTFNTGGLTEGAGKLTLTSNSTLDFGSGPSLLTFDGIGSSLGTSTLLILNWTGVIGAAGGTDRLLFDNSSFLAGTSSNLIVFSIGGSYYTADFKAVDANTVEAVAGMSVVPEPSTIFAVSLLGFLVGWRERHRITGLLSSMVFRRIHAIA
jgi:autotransporter-associated beta strand protein